MAVYANEDGVMKDLTPFGNCKIKIFHALHQIVQNQSTTETAIDLASLIDSMGTPDHVFIFDYYYRCYNDSNSQVHIVQESFYRTGDECDGRSSIRSGTICPSYGGIQKTDGYIKIKLKDVRTSATVTDTTKWIKVRWANSVVILVWE